MRASRTALGWMAAAALIMASCAGTDECCESGALAGEEGGHDAALRAEVTALRTQVDGLVQQVTRLGAELQATRSAPAMGQVEMARADPPRDKISLPSLIVNLADTTAAVSSKINVVLELDTPSATLPGRFAKHGDLAPKFRDLMIMKLSAMQSSELKSRGGMERLRVELISEFNELLAAQGRATPRVANLYFDELLVQ